VRVHVIEDDYGVRDALIELATALGYAVLAYPDGESFVQAGPPGSTDLVFVDLGLPGMGGVEVIDWIRRLPSPPRIIAISGRPRVDIEMMLSKLPDLPLLRKPLSPEALQGYL
jgi:DNA-binding response OmpR family regulator